MQERLARMRELMAQHDQPAVLLHKPENFRYLSGYAGEGCALVTRDRQYIFTDFRYVEQAEIQAPGWAVVKTDKAMPLYTALSNAISDAHVEKVAVETDFISVDTYEQIKKAAGETRLESLKAKPEDLRMVKDAGEIECLRRAESITARSFNEVLGHIKPGMTEIELRAELEYIMLKLGAHGFGFDTIIASGKNGSICHAVPSEKKIEVGDFITMDYGATYNGYTADMTRTVALGNVTDEMKHVYNVVLEAQQKALDAMGPGKLCCDMDKVARDHIEAAGYGEYFGHSLGHATGLMIHEAPGCSWVNKTELKPGMSMTVEPGIYLPGKFGVRIEDLVIIEQSGVSNLALEAPKQLIIL